MESRNGWRNKWLQVSCYLAMRFGAVAIARANQIAWEAKLDRTEIVELLRDQLRAARWASFN